MALTPVKQTMVLTPAKTLHPNKDDDSQEGITVAIRMRPLNITEGNKERIWKVLPKYSSVTQTTREGNPLSERITGRTFFTFDKAFGEDANNRQVYDDVAKPIVTSVVEGLNGTIFAYGQTSSGKTYTMQGSGNLEQGSDGEGGIVHMAAKDIFSKIGQQQDRMFLVRVSFLEIYNEEVRDLLSDSNNTLQIREDPRRGVFVHSVEEIVTDFKSLLSILYRGDKCRTFAATGMNERSSRSHTILRITIESREKGMNDDISSDTEDIENQFPSRDGAVRISTLNLVDLAGSESVRHTGATGERQKEGGLINQSLLTLSRVMVALGTPNQPHINFRDSKLTRILQPSLSGNARMAVICCATPSELYLEETRSTLQFASRAKLVKTNAQVNEVLDERSMIRRLQRELAEAKRQQSGPGHQQVRALEEQVATVGTQAMEAKARLDRLKASILNGGYLFDQTNSVTSQISKKRRKSDGPILVGHKTPFKDTKTKGFIPKTAPREKKTQTLQHLILPAQQELDIVQQALASRNQFVRDLNRTIATYSEQIKNKNDDVERIMAENSSLNHEMSEVHAEADDLRKLVASLRETLESSVKENEQMLGEKDAMIMDSFAKIQQSLGEKGELEQKLSDLQKRFDDLQEERIRSAFEFAEITTENQNLLAERANDKLKLQEIAGKTEFLTSNLHEVSQERDQALTELTVLQNQMNVEKREAGALKEKHEVRITELQGRVEELNSIFVATQNENKILSIQISEVEQEKDALRELYASIEDQSRNEKESLLAQVQSMKSTIEAANAEIDQLRTDKEDTFRASQESKHQLESTLSGLESQLFLKITDITELEALVESMKTQHSQLEKAVDSLQAENEKSRSLVASITEEKEALACKLLDVQSELTDREGDLEESRHEKGKMNENLCEVETELELLRANQEKSILEHNEAVQAIEISLLNVKQELENEKAEIEMLQRRVSDMEEAAEHDAATRKVLEQSVDALQGEKMDFATRLNQTMEALDAAQSQVQLLCGEKDIVVAEKNSMEAVLCHCQQNLKEMEGHLAAAEEQIARMQSEKEGVIVENTLSLTKLLEVKEELETKQSEALSLSARISELEYTKNDMACIQQQQAVTIDLLNARIDEQEKAAAQVLQEKADTIKLFEMKEAELFESLQLHIVEKEEGIQELHCRLHETMSSMIERGEEIKTLCGTLSEAESQLELQKEALEHVIAEKDSLQFQLAGVESELSMLKEESAAKASSVEQLLSEKENAHQELVRHLEALGKERDSLQITLGQQEADLSLIKSEKLAKDSAVEQLEKEKEAFKSMLEEVTMDIETRNNEIQELRAELTRFTIEKQKFESLHGQLKESIKALTADNENVYGRLADMESQNGASISELVSLKAEYAKICNKNNTLEERVQESEKILADLKVERDDAEDELKTLQEQVSKVYEEARSLQARNQELEESHVMLQSELQHNHSTASQLQNELDNAHHKCEALIESLREREAERDEATAEVERLYEKNRELSDCIALALPKEIEEQLQSELSEMKKENLELRQLLASLNESEEKLRHAVTAAENEHMVRAKELDNALFHISQLEQELSHSKLACMQRNKVEESQTDYIIQIETLQKEKEEIKQLLREEKSARKTNEEILKKQMGEEQRMLIQEGESMMTELRKKIEGYEAKLTQSESEAYTARQHVEEINDERKKVEEKYLEASEKTSSLESTIKSQETQISTLQSDLNKAKSECYALKESIIDIKEKMRRSTRDSEKAARESELATSELNTLRKKLSNLESQIESSQSENARLRKKLHHVGESEKIIDSLKKNVQEKESEVEAAKKEIAHMKLEDEATRNELAKLKAAKDNLLVGRSKNEAEEFKQLQQKFDRLQELLNQKDQRIKKLEKNRLTKDQLETIKKMKSDNIKYEKEHTTFKSEITRLQSQISSMGTDSELRAEISELRFNKDALETKLRKFATHCQRLEDDKAGMADALRSCNIDIEAYDSDISEAIIHLCDRLTSIEDAHSKCAINKGSSLDSLQKENQSLRQTIDKMAQAEQKLTKDLNLYHHEIDNLKKFLEKEASSSISDELKRKLIFLEQENLQLMIDVKSTKKQLQSAREELESLRIKVDQNPTADFGTMDFLQKSSMNKDLSSVLDGSQKESSDTTDLTDLARACSGKKAPLGLKRARESQQKAILSDSTNQFETNMSKKFVPTGDKRQRLGDAAEKTGRKRVTPGLGEASSLDSDSTGDCNQS